MAAVSQQAGRAILGEAGMAHGNCFLEVCRTIALVSSPAFAKEAAFVHDKAHLSFEDIAAATGAAPSTARAWV
ncbi:MAG: hypothetical protein WBM00_10470, partial [Solirubrobacterales bacterium]